MYRIILSLVFLFSATFTFAQQELVTTYSFFGNVSTYEVEDEHLALIEVIDKDNITFEVKKIEEEGVTKVLVPIKFNPDQDLFKIEATSIIKVEMYIFNQWGEFVYETTEGIEGWNGYTQDGKVKTGPYVYTMKLTTKDREIKKISGCVYIE